MLGLLNRFRRKPHVEMVHQHRFVPLRRGFPQRICKCGAMKIGRNTITLSPSGSDVIRYSGTQAALAPGDIGMDVATGRPSGFIGGANEALAALSDISAGGGTAVDHLAWGGDTTGAVALQRFADKSAAAVAGGDITAEIEIVASGTLRNLRLDSDGAAGTLVMTVFVNGIATSITATLPSGAGGASDLANTHAVVAGDKVEIRAAGTQARVSTAILEFESASATGVNSKAVLGWGATLTAVPLSSSFSLQRWDRTGNVINLAVGDGNAIIEMPYSGTIRNLRVRMFDNGGAPTTVWDVVVRVNSVDSAVTVTGLTGGSDTGSDTTNTVAVNAGDLVEIKATHAAVAGSNTASFLVDLELDSSGALAQTVMSSVFDVTHVSGTFSTGALGFTPTFCQYVGAVNDGLNFAHMAGFARGTGALAKGSAMQFDAAGFGVAAASGAVGGVAALPPGNSFAATLGVTLSVTAFASAGISLAWSGAVTSHQGGLLVVGLG